MKTGGDVSSKSDFVRLTTKEFKLTAKKINMMKIKAFALMGQLPLLRDFVITLNKKSEVIHYDIIFEYLDSQGLQQVK